MAPYLALAGLLSAGWWAENDVRRLRVATTRLQRTALAGLVIALGLFDQVPRNVAPSNTGLRDHLHSVQQLVSGMDAALPEGAQVFQLPITTFPEAGPTRELEDYSLLEPYLSTSSDLHWSYGGLRGRESDWQLAWGTQPLRPMLEGIASCGFKARQYYCQCPACGGGETFPPRQTAEFDTSDRHLAHAQLEGKPLHAQ